MTLKKFLTENNINISDADRSRIGHLLQRNRKTKFKKINEDGFLVNDYDEKYLNNINTQKKIIEFLSNR